MKRRRPQRSPQALVAKARRQHLTLPRAARLRRQDRRASGCSVKRWRGRGRLRGRAEGAADERVEGAADERVEGACGYEGSWTNDPEVDDRGGQGKVWRA
eukprot:6205406-Pleurochrysis_carterae.AAC.2